MGQALYRKYRSKSLDEIVGQSHVTDILRRALANDNVAHAYLLTGPRGVGKTSIARILAHEINQLPYTAESTHLDIIEIDAASNNSVEDIRDLRDKVMVSPVSAKKKIYIIDEVHMLTKSAFNALLKTLEEPPAHVVFILATTDVEKLPATIISRVQRFNFRAIGQKDTHAHLQTIAKAENIAITDEALALISRHGNGSFRDSISLLDQLRNAADETIDVPHIERVLGLAEATSITKLIDAYSSADLATIVSTLDDLESRGMPAIVICEQLVREIHFHVASNPELLTLLDALLEVPRSSWPHIKLLTVLSRPIADAPAAISRGAAPKVTTTPPAKPAATPQPVKKIVKPAPAEPPVQHAALEVEKQPEVTRAINPQPFAWFDFLEQVKESATGAHSLLIKCGYEFDGTILTIFAGKKFGKTQIDKALPTLSAALHTFGVDADIVVLPVPKPPEDSQTAAILDIMGGGEEVNL